MYPMTHLINAALDGAPAFGRPDTACTIAPRTNILEGERDYRIVMDLPGVRNEDLEISLEAELLTVKARRGQEIPEGYRARRSELPASVTWQRSFNVGNGIDADGIGAALDHGVLTITLPRSEKTLPRRIQVQ